MDLGDFVDAGSAVGGGVNDEHVGNLLQDSGSQRLPASGSYESVLRSQYDFEVLFERARQISDDVHEWPDGMS
jgi:hypothetical protein